MKKALLLLATLGFAQVQAQSLSIVEMDTVLEVNSMAVTDNNFHIVIENTTAASVDVFAVRAYSTANCAFDSGYFCWDYCYTTQVDSSIGSLPIAPGASSSAFSGHVFSPNTGVSCTDSVRYLFYVDKSANDTVSAWVTISAGPTMGTVNLQVRSAKLYPNPARGEVFVETSKAVSFEMYNALGMRVMSRNLIAGKNRIDVSALSNGVYLYKVGNGEVKRLIVNH